MKRGKKLGILLIAFVLICSAAVVAIKLNPETTTSGGDDDTAINILTLDTDKITELSWNYNEENLSFTCADSTWTYSEDEAFPLDSSYMDTMLSKLASIDAAKTIENAEDLSQYGLDDAVCTIQVTAESKYKLSIGNESGMGGERYLSLGDGNVYLVDSAILDSFSYGLYDLVLKETIPTMTDLSSFTITTDSQKLELVYLEESSLAYSDSYVWFMKNGDSYVTLDTELTETLTENVTGLTWGECVSYNATDEKLAEYGLDTPAVTVTVAYKDDDSGDGSFTLEIGKYIDDGAYTRISGSQMVYMIDSSVYDDLIHADYTELLPDEVLLMDYDEVTAVDVILDGNTYHIEKSTQAVTDEEGESTEETVWTLDGEEFDVGSTLDKITALTSTGSVQTASNKSAEIEFIFYRDNEAFPKVDLIFYQYDSSSCLVSLNGESRLLVSRSSVVSIVEAINTLILE